MREIVKKFVDEWRGTTYEKGESQKFWIELLRKLFGIENPKNFIKFEQHVKSGFIDALIPMTKVLIEQKSAGKNLVEAYEQAKRYDNDLTQKNKSRYIVVCDFKTFHIYDMNAENPTPKIIDFENLPDEFHSLDFLVNINRDFVVEEKISIDAGAAVGQLYKEILSQYSKDELNDELYDLLNKFCVRLVFCLYSDSADIFGEHKIFRDCLSNFRNIGAQTIIKEIFKMFNQKERTDSEFNIFPYVNGGLFAEEIEIPRLSKKFLSLLIDDIGVKVNWSGISPTIFGAVFESTLTAFKRRAGGMHYTSVENIHKVIDPLFMDDLSAEFQRIRAIKVKRTRRKNLEAFQNKLATLQFLDPACGSGNFLTETYISLRRLENEVLKEILGVSVKLGDIDDPIKVKISQFHGIEIDDFAVSVAKTALWIAESQMMSETASIVNKELEFLPLKTSANIQKANALKIDWKDVAPNVDFIIGNPPFVGARMMKQGSRQKIEVENIFNHMKNVQDLDYVCCWYKKAAEYISKTQIRCAFVSTNSITQGAQVPLLWKIIFNDYKIHIDFAYRSFKWYSESTDMAQVHCVVIGFSQAPNDKPKIIFDDGGVHEVQNINGYLLDAENIFVEASKEPLCDVPKMNFGNQPRDGGNFILTEDEKSALLEKYPELKKFIRLYIGAEEFINNKRRYCFWLVDAAPNEIKNSKILFKVVEVVRNFRLASTAKTTRGYAKVPTQFAQITQPPNVDYIIVPRVSSEHRNYIPIGFMSKEIISSDAVLIIPKANLYHFGILTSKIHMAWTKIICGRLKSDYRYSKEIVYNNFVWCNPSENQRKKIELTAQNILDVRAKFPNSSLADLYDENSMPVELRKAHQQNDVAVMQAYGFDKNLSEAEIVAELMKLYQKISH